VLTEVTEVIVLTVAGYRSTTARLSDGRPGFSFRGGVVTRNHFPRLQGAFSCDSM
jgi:hypothetical protein